MGGFFCTLLLTLFKITKNFIALRAPRTYYILSDHYDVLLTEMYNFPFYQWIRYVWPLAARLYYAPGLGSRIKCFAAPDFFPSGSGSLWFLSSRSLYRRCIFLRLWLQLLVFCSSGSGSSSKGPKTCGSLRLRLLLRLPSPVMYSVHLHLIPIPQLCLGFRLYSVHFHTFPIDQLYVWN